MILSYHELLKAATHIPAADTHAANGWLLQLANVLKANNLAPYQRSYLYRLRRIWKQRAAGRDARWNDYGSEPGAKKPRRWPTSTPTKKRAGGVSVPLDQVAAKSGLDRAEAPAEALIPAPLSTPSPPIDNTTPAIVNTTKPGISSLLEKYGR